MFVISIECKRSLSNSYIISWAWLHTEWDTSSKHDRIKGNIGQVKNCAKEHIVLILGGRICQKLCIPLYIWPKKNRLLSNPSESANEFVLILYPSPLVSLTEIYKFLSNPSDYGYECVPIVYSSPQWFSPGTPVSSTNKTDRHDITEILLKEVLNTITLTLSLNSSPPFIPDRNI